MNFYLMVLPSVFLYVMVFLNVCRIKFTVIEIVFCVTLLYVASAIAIFVSAYIPIQTLSADVTGNLVLAICLTFIARKKTRSFLSGGLFAFSTMVITMVCGTIVGTIALNAFGLFSYDIQGSLAVFILTTTLIFLLAYVVSKHVGIQLHQCYVFLPDALQKKFFLYGFVLSSLAYALTQVNVFVYRIAEDRVLLSSVNTILITSIFFVAAVTLVAYSRSQQKILEAEHQAKSLEDLAVHNQQLEAAYDEIRSHQHDHLSLLQSFMGFVDGKNQSKMKEHLSESIKFTKEALAKLDDSVDRLKYVHIPELKGLLSVKFAHALSKNVEVKLDIADPVDNIPINHMDLCRIVGIMIDNAVEELTSGDYEIKLLKFGIILDDDDVLIVCSNVCKTPPPVEEIFKKGYTSKGLNRGLGLYNLKKIGAKYENLFITAYPKENEFDLRSCIQNKYCHKNQHAP